MRRFAVPCLAIAANTLVMLVFGVAATSAQSLPITSQTQRALDFYGGRSARATLSAMPRRSAIQPTTTGRMPHNGKPFQSVTTAPTVSPYMNLFRDEERTTDAAPNYFAFVRPQLEQQAASHQQQREIELLQRQFQGGSQYPAATLPGAGTRARFMDTAQFYGGWQR